MLNVVGTNLSGRVSKKRETLMRRFTLSSFFAVLTFALGVGLTLLSYRFFPPTVSLCELARHPEWYDQAVVRVNASASGIYEGLIISETGCEAEDAWAVVSRDESYTPGPEVESFLISSNREIRKADVLLVGRFDRNATMGCFGPRFGIRVTSVELKSPVTVEPLP